MNKKFWISFAAAFVIFGLIAAIAVAMVLGQQYKPIDLSTKDNASGETSGGSTPDGSSTGGGKERLNVLIAATDKGGLRTDTIMLMSADKLTGKLNIISVPRDTRVMINGAADKINACTVFVNFQNLIDTVEKITGMNIDYYVLVKTDGFRNVIDILGGVEFDVPQNMKYSDPSQGLYINLKKGKQILDGNKAEQLLRFRSYIEGDIQRTRVQKAFIKALITQKATPANILKAPALFTEIAKNVRTNINAGDVLMNLDAVKFMVGDKIETYEIPGYDQTIDGISYYILKEQETYDLFKACFGGDGKAHVDGSDEVLADHNISGVS